MLENTKFTYFYVENEIYFDENGSDGDVGFEFDYEPDYCEILFALMKAIYNDKFKKIINDKETERIVKKNLSNMIEELDDEEKLQDLFDTYREDVEYYFRDDAFNSRE